MKPEIDFNVREQTLVAGSMWYKAKSTWSAVTGAQFHQTWFVQRSNSVRNWGDFQIQLSKLKPNRWDGSWTNSKDGPIPFPNPTNKQGFKETLQKDICFTIIRYHVKIIKKRKTETDRKIMYDSSLSSLFLLLPTSISWSLKSQTKTHSTNCNELIKHQRFNYHMTNLSVRFR